jgi:hypothetical protein
MKRNVLLMLFVYFLIIFTFPTIGAVEVSANEKTKDQVSMPLMVPTILDTQINKEDADISISCPSDSNTWTGNKIVPINISEAGEFTLSYYVENGKSYPEGSLEVYLFDNEPCTGDYIEPWYGQMQCNNPLDYEVDATYEITKPGTYYLEWYVDYGYYGNDSYNINTIPTEVNIHLSYCLFDVSSERSLPEGKSMAGESLFGATYYYKLKLDEDGIVNLNCTPAFYYGRNSSNNHSNISLCNSKKEIIASTESLCYTYLDGDHVGKTLNINSKYCLKKGTYYIKVQIDYLKFNIGYTFDKNSNTSGTTKKNAKNIKIDGTTYDGIFHISNSKTVGNWYKFTLDKTTDLLFTYKIKVPNGMEIQSTWLEPKIAKTKDYVSYKYNHPWFNLSDDGDLLKKTTTIREGARLPKGTYYIWIDNNRYPLMNGEYSLSIKMVSKSTAQKYFTFNNVSHSLMGGYECYVNYDKKYYGK